MVYKSISVVLNSSCCHDFIAAHHEKKSDVLASLKQAFNLQQESWSSGDFETHFSTVHSEHSRVNRHGEMSYLKSTDNEVRKERWLRNFNNRQVNQA